MAADDHLSDPQFGVPKPVFYHGQLTDTPLKPGDWVTSARNRGEPGRGNETANYTYFASRPDVAREFAHGDYTLSREDAAKPSYIYKVQPAAPSRQDPDYGPGAYRSRGPLLVTGVHKSFPSHNEQFGPDNTDAPSVRNKWHEMENW
jgi:hypothetical protein